MEHLAAFVRFSSYILYLFYSLTNTSNNYFSKCCQSGFGVRFKQNYRCFHFAWCTLGIIGAHKSPLYPYPQKVQLGFDISQPNWILYFFQEEFNLFNESYLINSVSRVSINIGDLEKEFLLVFKTSGGNSHHVGPKGL